VVTRTEKIRTIMQDREEKPRDSQAEVRERFLNS